MVKPPSLLLAFGPLRAIEGMRQGWQEYQNYFAKPGGRLTAAAEQWRDFDQGDVRQVFTSSNGEGTSLVESLMTAALGASVTIHDCDIATGYFNESWVTTALIPFTAMTLGAGVLWPPSSEAMQGFVASLAHFDGREWIDWQLEKERERPHDTNPTDDFLAAVEAHKAGHFDEAEQLYERAGKAGVPIAQYNLALMCSATGRDAQAAYWLEEAAGRGFPPAQHNLAIAYDRGIGIPIDKGRAAFWYERAASAGMSASMQNLGLLLLDGDGVPRDPKSALSWFRRAAEAGLPEAQKSMAVALANGWGTEPDDVEALKWFEVLSLRGLDEIDTLWLERRMTVEQVSRARRLAADWLDQFDIEENRQWRR